jgi:hypothetical protein
VRRAVAIAPAGHFFDKDWVHVGSSRGTEYVWATYTDFRGADTPLGYDLAQIYAVRCTADLATCTNPILISPNDQDTQFSDVTVGPDGRTYVTWVRVEGEFENTPQVFTIKLRVAEPGSTTFGPERVVAVERLPIPFGGLLHANDFRVATYPKHDVRLVNGRPVVSVVWDACRARPLDVICEEPSIKIRSTTNLGVSFGATRTLSAGGDNYFPTIANDPRGNNLAVAWYTNRYDPIFHNRQDVELVTVSGTTGGVVRRQRVTRVSNETEADPLLGGVFIGDYLEVTANRGQAWVHYNANERHVALLGEGLPIPQQDNYLTRVHE